MKERKNITNTLQQNNNVQRGKTRLVLVLALVCTLLVAFGFATPQSASAASSHATTPATANQPASSNGSSIADMINSVFGPYAASAQHIAMCESTMNPNATNSVAIGGSHAAGLFQILYPSTWNTTSQAGASPYDAHANIVAAHEIFVRDGYSWREWECQ